MSKLLDIDVYRSIGITILVVLLFSCLPQSTTRQEFNREKTVITRYHVYENKRELQKVTGKKSGQAVWSPNDQICDVYLVRWDFESTGHEIHHCLYGSFHKEKH